MKKMLIWLLSMVMILTCLISCNVAPPEQTDRSSDSTEPKKEFTAPADESRAEYTVSSSTADGLKMEITVHGYKSESLNKDFYVKNNEYFLVDVKVTNESENELYQWLGSYCRHSLEPSHNHEIGFDISHGEYQLHSSSFGFNCPMAIDVWKLEPGATYKWQLKLAAGEAQSGTDYDLPADVSGHYEGIVLYDEAIYTDGVCAFSGDFSFDYGLSMEGLNDRFLSVPMEIDVVFVSAEAVTAEKS